MKLENFTLKNNSWFGRMLKLGLIPALMLLVAWNVGAQSSCPLACNDLVQVSLDDDCIVTITPDMMLEGQGTDVACTYTVTVLGSDNLPIVGSPNVNGAYIGKTLTVRVNLGQNSCWGSIAIEDKMPPYINCPDDITINCYDNRTFTNPTAGDNCSSSVTVKVLSNDIVDQGCGDTYTAIRTIKYQATDASGNKSQICERHIYYSKVTLSQVIFPRDKDDIQDPILECDNIPFWDSQTTGVKGYPDVAETGGPTIDGIPIYPNNSLCELNATFSDQRIDICENSFKVLRHWTVLDWCTGEIANDYQIIKVLDREPPIVTCVPDNPHAVPADPYDCFADWVVPPPTVIYDCSSTTYTVGYLLADSNGQPPVNGIYITDNVVKVGNTYTIQNLPVGRTWVRYKITDACGNFTYCFTEIDVYDDVPPVAVCDEFTVVTLTTGGVAQIFATTFDDGSHDNCTAVKFDARRMTAGCGASTTAWTSAVNFCCTDVGKDIMVSMRVTDANNNSNTCMVTVRVQDKIDPVIVCPANITINCMQTPVPATTGTATATDNCGAPTVTFSDSGTLTQCGVGTITRTWKATDAGGKMVTCTQRITVIDNDPFDVSDINWGPVSGVKNLTGCMDIDTDPSVTGSPTWTADDCSLVASTYSDQVFTFVDGACFKILRTWSIIDWCRFDQNNPNAGGLYQYTQVIKLNNTVKPVFDNCSNRTVCAYGENCDGFVELIQGATDDCTPADKLIWTYTVDFNNDGTINKSGTNNNASGIYPVGIHRVRWTVEDKCGNKQVCEYLVTVNDCKKPTPYCIGEITTVIMPSSGMIDIWASDFDLGSYDNCPGNLKISFSQNVNDTKRVFTCDNLGINSLQMWVTDVAGNKEFCSVKINIQANAGACGNNRVISGNISTETHDLVPNIEVNMIEGSSNELMSSLTSTDGLFQFAGMHNNETYQISAANDKDHANGVSTLDLVLIQRHILGTSKLNSPYKAIAADASGNGVITASDLVEIRKLVLGLNTKFASNKSWRFVDASQQFADVNKPWPFNEAINVNFNAESLLNNNFKAVKIGDVNGSAALNVNAPNAEPRSNKTLTLVIDEQNLSEGQLVYVPVKASEANILAGYQFTMYFDSELLDFEDINAGAMDMTIDNVGTNRLDRGVLTTSWMNADSKSVNKNETLFTLVFRAKTNGKLTHNMGVSSDVTKAEAYDANLDIMKVDMEFRNGTSINNEVTLFQNSPNPFEDHTNISFTMPKAAFATITIFDIAGKQVFQTAGDFQKGTNTVKVNADKLNASGLLYYQFETEGFKATRKMILIRK